VGKGEGEGKQFEGAEVEQFQEGDLKH